MWFYLGYVSNYIQSICFPQVLNKRKRKKGDWKSKETGSIQTLKIINQYFFREQEQISETKIKQLIDLTVSVKKKGLEGFYLTNGNCEQKKERKIIWDKSFKVANWQ